MNEIEYPMSCLPLVLEAGILKNSKSFIPKTRQENRHILRYITTGGITSSEAGITYELNPGSLILYKAGLLQTSSVYSKPNTSWIYIHFHTPFFPTLQNNEYKDYLPLMASTSLSPSAYNHTITLPKCVQLPPGNAILPKLERLVTLFQSTELWHLSYQNALLLEILMDVCSFHSNNSYYSPEVSTTTNLLHYLNDHIHEPFRSEKIASVMNMNYKYLCEVFKKETGTTIQQYHTALKMREAAKYLRTTELTISEISTLLGYSDPLYFSNVFKKSYDISPKAYRKEHHSYKIP